MAVNRQANKTPELRNDTDLQSDTNSHIVGNSHLRHCHRRNKENDQFCAKYPVLFCEVHIKYMKEHDNS